MHTVDNAQYKNENTYRQFGTKRKFIFKQNYYSKEM